MSYNSVRKPNLYSDLIFSHLLEKLVTTISVHLGLFLIKFIQEGITSHLGIFKISENVIGDHIMGSIGIIDVMILLS